VLCFVAGRYALQKLTGFKAVPEELGLLVSISSGAATDHPFIKAGSRVVVMKAGDRNGNNETMDRMG
jgi:hypothetical protein